MNILPPKEGEEYPEAKKAKIQELKDKLTQKLEKDLKDMDTMIGEAQEKCDDSKDKRNENLDQI